MQKFQSGVKNWTEISFGEGKCEGSAFIFWGSKGGGRGPRDRFLKNVCLAAFHTGRRIPPS